MRNYEVTFIVDPTLSSDEVKATAQKYVDMLTSAGYQIVHINEIGLQQLAYEIKKRHSGMYFCIEFAGENGNIIDKMELTLRRDEKILRFLTVALDKFGVKYNQDKRDGKIGKKNRESIIKKKKDEDDDVDTLEV
jgi:small subunit ribosomal protein S6